jgi:hypothetical protein
MGGFDPVAHLKARKDGGSSSVKRGDKERRRTMRKETKDKIDIICGYCIIFGSFFLMVGTIIWVEICGYQENKRIKASIEEIGEGEYSLSYVEFGGLNRGEPYFEIEIEGDRFRGRRFLVKVHKIEGLSTSDRYLTVQKDGVVILTLPNEEKERWEEKIKEYREQRAY